MWGAVRLTAPMLVRGSAYTIGAAVHHSAVGRTGGRLAALSWIRPSPGPG